jgi:phosphoglycerate dehydrogenase-like enzyme
MLGYGALGRETARLLKSHGMRVIAANTSGKATTQDGVSHFVSHPHSNSTVHEDIVIWSPGGLR